MSVLTGKSTWRLIEYYRPRGDLLLGDASEAKRSWAGPLIPGLKTSAAMVV